MQIVLPYQNHINKQIFDYMLICNNQLNNVNGAIDMNSAETKKDNHAYIVINSDGVFMSIILSKKDIIKSCYSTLTDIWVKLNDIILDEVLYSEERIYSFDIKKFFSVLSFSSDYKDRKNIQLLLTPLLDKIYYKVSDAIGVDLATSINDDNIIKHIRDSYSNYIAHTNISSYDSNICLDVDSVDKNSFLLPYANHKDCLNFSVSDSYNCAMIYKNESNTYIECVRNNMENTADLNSNFMSTVLLRDDKFHFYHNFCYISPGVWQVLTILQGIKTWVTFRLFDDNYGVLELVPNVKIYYMFNNDYYCASHNKHSIQNFLLVGKLYANEIFTLNKLFSNMKTSYFDFSLQQFVGTNYVFSEDKEEIKEVKLLYTCENNMLPLRISFTELKHYIGGDLSQKDFILYVLFDGVNVIIQRWNNSETILEYNVMFNHAMSKKYLSI